MVDYSKKFKLDNKTAFVVGGLGLIGKEVSKAFASVGAKTIILDLSNKFSRIIEHEMQNLDYNIHFEHFDCADMNNIETNFNDIINRFGCPDIYINSAYPRTKDWGKSSFQKGTIQSFRKNVDIQMNSSSWLAKLAAENMVNSNVSGSIIQLGSIYGILGQDLSIYQGTDMRENMAYAAIKGGIINFTRQMASYYGQFNIRVNVLCPGGIEGHVAGKNNIQNPKFIKQYSNKTPLKRLGQVEEIASSALFLGSEASSYITGATILVDGGFSAI